MNTTTPARVGLMRSAEHLDNTIGKARDKQPHDTLHQALRGGFCGCLCPRCWRWADLARRRGVCLCFECPCGGATWLPRGAAVVGA